MANETIDRAKHPSKPPENSAKPEQVEMPRTPWLAEQEAFLIKHGWIKVDADDWGNAVWTDPIGIADQSAVLSEPDHKGNQHWVSRKTRKIVLPTTEEGKTETIEQVVFDPIPWNYTTPRALIIQNQRNRTAAAKTA